MTKMQSISSISVIILISINSITGQWMQLFDTNLDPFQTLSPLTVSGDYQLPKKEKTIPIIVMLKPKRGKGLTPDAHIERKNDNESQNNFNFNQLLQQIPGIIEQNTDNNQPAIDTYETRQTASILPMPANYIPQQNLMLQQIPAREENIHWPTTDFEKQLNEKTISSIDSLLPQFAAISESNQKQLAANLGQNIDGIHSFEDAFKKFTSNLTNLEHSSDDSLEDRMRENVKEVNDETTTHSTQNGKSSTLLSNTEQSTIVTEDSDVTSDDKELLAQTTREDVEPPYSQEIAEELVHKPSPLTSNRQRIKAPVLKPYANMHNSNDREVFKGFQPVTNNNDDNEWVPIKSKKSKKRPIRQHQQQISQQQQQQNRQQLEKPQNTLILNDLQKNHLYGLPQLQQQQPFIQRPQQPFHGIIQPQKFYAAYTTPMMSYPSPQQSVPNIFKTASSAQHFNNLNHGVRANGFTHPSPYFSALEMQGNANKPQHTEPMKDEESDEEDDLHEKHRHHDMDEEKEDMKKEKDRHKMDHHKDMITEDKKEISSPEGHIDNDLLTKHLSCCHQLLGQHSPHHELTPPIEEDKYIQSLVEEVHPSPHHFAVHHNRHHNHHFRHHPHIKFGGEPCHEDEVMVPTHTQYYLPNFPPLPPKPVLPPPITRLHYKPNFSFYKKPSLLWG